MTVLRTFALAALLTVAALAVGIGITLLLVKLYGSLPGSDWSHGPVRTPDPCPTRQCPAIAAVVPHG